MDMPTKTFFESFSAIVKKTNYVPGDEIIAIADMPGLVLYLGGYSPGSPWFSTYLEGFSSSCDLLAVSKLSHQKALLILSDDVINDPSFPALVKCMNQYRVNFPDSYIYVDKLINPFSNSSINIFMSNTKY